MCPANEGSADINWTEILAQAWQAIEKEIHAACTRANRSPAEVTLVAASKTQPKEAVLAFQELFQSLGLVPVLGENYVQEGKKRREYLNPASKLHLIGPLQRNKVKLAVQIFDVIESVHSIEVAEALNQAALGLGKVQDIFVQVNISADVQKSGFAPESLTDLFEHKLPKFAGLNCQGLMTITRDYDDRQMVRPDFGAMRELANRISTQCGGRKLALSMGMSQDFDIALEEGASHIRLGTRIFGKRLNQNR